jgi:16S rRNA (guanine527-N7)-methyltransferase
MISINHQIKTQFVELILKYFPSFTTLQKDQLSKLESFYIYWNQRVNLISRQDIDSLWVKHVLHSLAIAKVFRFPSGTRILDIGTGGGFPGIPLAIAFPECHFHLIDSIGKKVNVVNHAIAEFGLQNVVAKQIRAEQAEGRFDFVVTRAVAPLQELINWTGKKIIPGSSGGIHHGLIALKGGELEDEIKPFQKRTEIWDLSNLFEEPFFETKKMIKVNYQSSAETRPLNS